MAISSPSSDDRLLDRRLALSSTASGQPDINTKSATITPITTDRGDRTSFSSVKESHTTGIAQTFTDSKTSSILRPLNNEEAILDDSSSGSVNQQDREQQGRKGMLTHPHSLLHGHVCSRDEFKGWKGIALGGKVASKSYGDLKSLEMRWTWEARSRNGTIGIEAAELQRPELVQQEEGLSRAGSSGLEKLPMELLGCIIDQLAIDIPPNGFSPRNMDLMSLLLASRTMHAATLPTLYRHITIPHSRIFRKFLSHISDYPSLGTIAKRIDFSHFNPTGAGMTARERAQTQNLIPETLSQCLALTPNLREFLAQEHVDEDLDSKVIQTLLCDLPKLAAVDFCACSSTQFRDNFTAVTNAIPSPLPPAISIARLSLHECTILPASVFETLLPKLTHLTHLDSSHTRITDTALHSIPSSARLTHLNLSNCSYLSGSSVVDFLANHPAAKTLVYLNLAMDIKYHEMLSGADLTSLLPTLPSTLKSLNLKGSKMNKDHIPLLLPLSKHLEELGLGFQLDLVSITSLLFPSDSLPLEEQMEWTPHTLRYIDASDLSSMQLDLSTLFGSRCPVLKVATEPLEVIEVSAEVAKRLNHAQPVLERVGWCVKEAGRRIWLVRMRGAGRIDEGGRWWKMGAEFWGMRKVPVAVAEVGGMYGHYMFKR